MSDRNLWINDDSDVVHPNAPAGGGGAGFFKSAAPLGVNLDITSPVPHPFSPVGRNTVPTEEQKQQLSDGGTPDAGVIDELPKFTSTTGIPLDVRADTVDEFGRNCNAALGDKNEVGHMQPTINYNLEIDDIGRVTKVNMVVDTQIVRPRWAGGRANDTERALIKRAEELIKAHEERHRDIAKTFTARACKEMRGKAEKKAEEIFKKVMKEMDKAQDAFDALEGKIIVEHGGPNGNAGPATGVRTGPRK